MPGRQQDYTLLVCLVVLVVLLSTNFTESAVLCEALRPPMRFANCLALTLLVAEVGVQLDQAGSVALLLLLAVYLRLELTQFSEKSQAVFEQCALLILWVRPCAQFDAFSARNLVCALAAHVARALQYWLERKREHHQRNRQPVDNSYMDVTQKIVVKDASSRLDQEYSPNLMLLNNEPPHGHLPATLKKDSA